MGRILLGVSFLWFATGCGGGGEGGDDGAMGGFAAAPAGQFTATFAADDGTEGGESKTVVVSKGFQLARFELTRAQYRQVLGDDAPDAVDGAEEECPDCPATGISDVELLLERANGLGTGYYRLPSDVEWFYAALDAGAASNGLGIPPEATLDDYAWHAGNSGGAPHPVGLKRANRLGLHDMLGNVGEWVVATPLTGAPEGSSYRICVGGSFDSPIEDPSAAGARSPTRVAADHQIGGYFRNESVLSACGIRLVREERAP